MTQNPILLKVMWMRGGSRKIYFLPPLHLSYTKILILMFKFLDDTRVCCLMLWSVFCVVPLDSVYSIRTQHLLSHGWDRTRRRSMIESLSHSLRRVDWHPGTRRTQVLRHWSEHCGVRGSSWWCSSRVSVVGTWRHSWWSHACGEQHVTRSWHSSDPLNPLSISNRWLSAL